MPDPSLTSRDSRVTTPQNELADLQKKQWDALEAATYIGMTAEQAREHEKRASRIVELQRNLGVKLNPPPLPW